MVLENVVALIYPVVPALCDFHNTFVYMAVIL